MKIKNKYDIQLLILVFLLSLNVFDKFYYLTLFLFIVVLFNILIKGKNISFNTNMILIFAFCIFYSFFNAEVSSITIKSIAHDLLYFLGYFSGYLLINVKNEKYENIYEKYILAMVTGTCLHGILNVTNNIKVYGFYINIRSLPDYWTGAMWSATGQATLFVLIVGYSYYVLFVKTEKSTFTKIFVTIGLVVAIFYNLITASRTIFIIILIVYLISFISSLFLENKKTKFRSVISLIIVLLVLIYFYFNNIFGIRGFVENMPLFNRLANPEMTGINNDPRLDRMKFVVQNFWEYPFGGLNFRNQVGYAHNLWFDAYDVAGIIPLALLLLFTVGVLKNIVLIIKSRKVTSNFKILIIGIYSALMIQFMVEPILAGVPWLFILFCIFAGMTDRYCKYVSVKKIERK